MLPWFPNASTRESTLKKLSLPLDETNDLDTNWDNIQSLIPIMLPANKKRGRPNEELFERSQPALQLEKENLYRPSLVEVSSFNTFMNHTIDYMQQ